MNSLDSEIGYYIYRFCNIGSRQALCSVSKYWKVVAEFDKLKILVERRANNSYKLIKNPTKISLSNIMTTIGLEDVIKFHQHSLLTFCQKDNLLPALCSYFTRVVNAPKKLPSMNHEERLQRISTCMHENKIDEALGYLDTVGEEPHIKILNTNFTVQDNYCSNVDNYCSNTMQMDPTDAIISSFSFANPCDAFDFLFQQECFRYDDQVMQRLKGLLNEIHDPEKKKSAENRLNTRAGCQDEIIEEFKCNMIETGNERSRDDTKIDIDYHALLEPIISHPDSRVALSLFCLSAAKEDDIRIPLAAVNQILDPIKKNAILDQIAKEVKLRESKSAEAELKLALIYSYKLEI